MRINNINVLAASKDVKTNKNNEEYFIISLLALEDGTTFNIIVKDKDIADKIAPMNKYIINLSLSSSQYGLKLDIVQVVKALGSIID